MDRLNRARWLVLAATPLADGRVWIWRQIVLVVQRNLASRLAWGHRYGAPGQLRTP